MKKLLEVLQELVEQGNSVVVIEHNLEVVKTADWVIDMGPEGGDGGGTIVAQGPPEAIVREPASYTGQFLKEVLARRPAPAVDKPAVKEASDAKGPGLTRERRSGKICSYAKTQSLPCENQWFKNLTMRSQ